MNITTSDVILLAHAAFGVLGSVAALWVFAEALNAQQASAGRVKAAALATAFSMVAAWVCGGYWYLHFYPAEKAILLHGPWPFAHNVVMETKEHLFFATAILALLLPIATREKLNSNSPARALVLAIAGLVFVTGLGLEAAGAIIDHGVKIALLENASKGASR